MTLQSERSLPDGRLAELVATILRLEALTPGQLNAFQGAAMHRKFLELIESRSAAWSAGLHEQAPLKPFTVSGLLPAAGTPTRRLVRPGQTYRWRVTTFSEPVTRLWLESVLPHLPPKMTIDQVSFAIRGWTTEASEDHLAGTASFAGLAAQAQHRQTADASGTRVHLRFMSPTTFHSQGVQLPLPVPQLLVSSWLHKWNAFSPIPLPLSWQDLPRAQYALCQAAIRTLPVRWGLRLVIGFLGDCTLTARNSDPPWSAALDVLSNFSFWCGTGHHAPYGFGQTVRQG